MSVAKAFMHPVTAVKIVNCSGDIAGALNAEGIRGIALPAKGDLVSLRCIHRHS